MSRETKIGLVVSCSFLCLVGAVVYTKLKQGVFRPSADGEADAELVAKSGAPPEPAPAGEHAHGADGQTHHIDQSEGSSGGQSGAPSSASSTNGGATNNDGEDGPVMPFGGGAVVPAAATTQPSRIRVDPKNTTEIRTPGPKADRENSRTSSTGQQGPPPAPTYDDDDTSNSDGQKDTRQQTIADTTTKQGASDGKRTPEAKAPNATVIDAVGTTTTTGRTTPKEEKRGDGSTATPATKAAPTANNLGNDCDPPPPFPASKDPRSKLPDPLPIMDGKPTAADPAKDANAQGVTPPAQPADTTDNRGTSGDKERSLDTSAAGLAGPNRLNNQSDGSNPKSAGATLTPDLIGTSPADRKLESQPGVNLGKPSAAAGAEITNMERGIGQPTSTTPFASNPTTPLGARADAVSPPITATTPDKIIPVAARTTAVAQAESWDEETYTCRANDTFKGISQQFYHSDRYDRALLLFNRNHPLAADWIRQDPPTPAAGQPVYIPPAHILEKRYAAAIPGLSSLPAAADAPKQPVGYRQYKVRPNGEMLLEIARRTLGASERWSDIHQLNKRYDPQKPIPPGTILWLPADARVEPGDQP